MMNNDDPEIVISDDFIQAMAKEAGLNVSEDEQLLAARKFMNLVADFCAGLCESKEDSNRISGAFIDPNIL